MAAAAQDRSVFRLPELERVIQRYPFRAIGFGFLTGFVCGGGQRSRLGQGLIGWAARIAVKQAVAATLAEALGNHEQRVGNRK
jgi:hypothetical protein